jgi:Mg/Co/Ni transporter MgtE
VRTADRKRLAAERLAKEEARLKAESERWTWDEVSGCLWTGCGWIAVAIIVVPFLFSIGPFVALVAICALVVALIFAAVFKK